MKDEIETLAQTIIFEAIELRNDIRDLTNSQRLTAQRRVELLTRTYDITDAAYRIQTRVLLDNREARLTRRTK